jgi:hypothetical protein
VRRVSEREGQVSMKLEGFVCLPSSAQVGDEGWRQVDRTNRP